MLERIIAIRRWQWLVIGLAVGLLVGTVRRAVAPITADDELLDRYPVVLTEQGTFEAALLDEVQGHRRFEDIVVYPGRAGSGGEARLYLVTGQFWDKREELVDGQAVARWVPACFVARGTYTPVMGLGATRAFPSVVAYLEQLQAQGKVQFRYAWWRWMTEGIAAWMAGRTSGKAVTSDGRVGRAGGIVRWRDRKGDRGCGGIWGRVRVRAE
jgi:hypothetical protein